MLQKIQQYIQEKINIIAEGFHKKSQERLTIMVIPHNHDRIYSHQLSWMMIGFLTALTLFVVMMALYAFYHRKSLKSDVAELKDLYGLNYNQANTLHQQTRITEDYHRELQSNLKEIARLIGIPEKELTILDLDPSARSRANEVLYEEVTQRLDMAPGTNYLPSVYSIKTNHFRMSDDYPMVLSIHEFLNQGFGVYAHMPMGRPFKTFRALRDTSPFGPRIDPVTRSSLEFHTGMDTSGPRGTPIYASGAGTVARVTHKDPGYGNSVLIQHKFGYRTLYAHMTRSTVRNGQRVRRGDLLGYMGATGRVTGVHLHYEIWQNSRKIDPLPYICSTDLNTRTCKAFYSKQ